MTLRFSGTQLFFKNKELLRMVPKLGLHPAHERPITAAHESFYGTWGVSADDQGVQCWKLREYEYYGRREVADLKTIYIGDANCNFSLVALVTSQHVQFLFLSPYAMKNDSSDTGRIALPGVMKVELCMDDYPSQFLCWCRTSGEMREGYRYSTGDPIWRRFE